ncbi:hypothetical protein EDB87DRAFT_1693317 [Lactarius vividus]|nr:hypothetical protein EDB87DRAFT_1693317 [Lactarius vividus]
MSQATGYSAFDEVPFVTPVRFATPVVFPLLQPPPPFKRGDNQELPARNAQAGSLHPSMSGEPETSSAHTATTTTPMPCQHIVVDPPPSGRELLPRSRPNPAGSSDVQSGSQPPAKKSHARKQPEGHIPRPRNAFILFRCDFVAQKKIPASVEPDHRNISRIVGRVWKAMSDEERRPWVEEAKKERETHKRLYPQYRYSPSSAATGTTGTSIRTKRAQNKKMRESMGVLPAWEVARQSPRLATQTMSSWCDRSPEPTSEPQQREHPQEEVLLQPPTQTTVSDGSCNAADGGGEAAPHTLFKDKPFSSADWEQTWGLLGAEPQHHSPRDGVAVTVGSFPDLNTPNSSWEMATPYESHTTSFHFDSPDPSPAESTQMLSPFMFVARHCATNNPGFSGFRFAPNPGEAPAASPFADALVNTDSAGQYQQHPTDHKTNPENLLENFAWTTEQIDGIIRNMQSGPSFDFVEPFVNL